MSLIHIAARLRYADKDWQTFLDQKYEGGSKKVRNPNQETKEHFPEVTVNHAMKDEHFRKHIQDEYEQWKDKGDSETKVGGHTIEITSDLKGHIDTVCNTYSDESAVSVDGMMRGIQLSVKKEQQRIERIKSFANPLSILGYTNKIAILEESQKIIKEMTPQEDFCLRGSHLLYPMIEESFLTNEERYHNTTLWTEWQGSSNNKSSRIIHQVLKARGVVGSSHGGPSNTGGYDEHKQTGDIVDKIYSIQQAVFKHLGITHITLYRGVEDDQLNTDPPSHGDKVKIKTMEAGSWSADPSISVEFGNRIVKCQVPVERILASPMIHPAFGDTLNTEFEYVVMGAEELEPEIFMDTYG